MGKRRKKPKHQPAPAQASTAPTPAPPRVVEGGWKPAAAIAAFAALIYAWTMGHAFVLDDLPVVRDNPTVQGHSFWAALTDSYWPAVLQTGAANWRPLATLSWWLEDGFVSRLGGPGASAAWLHHGVNALLHGGCTLALFPLARRLTRDVTWAWVACALFAVHPAHTEAVAPCVGRIDLLAGLGSLVLIEAWLRFRVDGAGPRWRWISLAAAAVGILGKESAVPVLLTLPLAERWIAGRSWPQIRTNAVAAFAPLGALLVLYVAARVAVLGAHAFAHAGAEELGSMGRLAFAGRNTVVSAGLLVAPIRFHHLVTTLPSDALFTYPAPSGGWVVVWPLLALPLWTGWVLLIRRAPRAAFCWVAALAAWAPTSGLLPAAAGTSLRFLFLPTAFAACGVVLGTAALAARHARGRLIALGVLGLWAIAGLGLTAWRIPAWKDNGTFYRRLLAEEPDCYTAAYGLGSFVAQDPVHRDLIVARGWFERALEIAGRNARGANAWMNLAQTWEHPPDGGDRYGPGADLPRALAEYERMLAAVPDSWQGHLNAGVVADRMGRLDVAYGHFERLLALQPAHPDRPTWLRKTIELAQRLGRLQDLIKWQQELERAGG